ncbi:hypothetical protein TanjilG_25166 [Lupinus angustifolius]|uniref:Uncharacterized protein n=1 Tax=Lupinus angustifolius TaxID=3871 RepID=A0A1J7GS23_LUPAN|nr:PREDICTED: uncharacterized protein LOC109334575 [Lupinus angustifolius]OIV92436.1 hypothetical protein TanjilG_25166 [Lupinus angustifolius]
MEPIDNKNSCESSFSKDEKMEAIDLLEECWFFENMLNIRPRMSRCYSDPCPSTGLISPDFLLKDSDVSSYSSTSKAPNNNAFVQPKKMHRTPSLPPFRVEQKDDKKGSKLVFQTSDHAVVQKASKVQCAQSKGHHRSDCNRRKSKLLRTPSLPPSIGREDEFQVSDSRTSKFPKQPSIATHFDILPPRQTTKSCSIPRPARNGEIESRRRFLNQKTMRRSLSDLEHEEVQGFKDLGFSFEKETLSPNLANIIPGLQDKNRDETEEDKAARKPYLSEAWLVQTCALPITPNWAPNKSKTYMKEQIKFWARAVASNVHQEC